MHKYPGTDIPNLSPPLSPNNYDIKHVALSLQSRGFFYQPNKVIICPACFSQNGMPIQAARSPEYASLTHPWLQANSHPYADLTKCNMDKNHPIDGLQIFSIFFTFLRVCYFPLNVQVERNLFLLIQIGHNSRADGAGELSNSRTQSTTCFQKQVALLGRYSLIGLTS